MGTPEIFSLIIYLNDFSSKYFWFILRTLVMQFFFFFFGLHSQHMQVPRLGAESELQLLAYATATAMQHLSRVCDPHRSSR